MRPNPPVLGTARIENWRLVNGCLFGQIEGHADQCTFHSHWMMTTKVVTMNVTEGWATTLNTRYNLGRQSNVDAD